MPLPHNYAVYPTLTGGTLVSDILQIFRVAHQPVVYMDATKSHRHGKVGPQTVLLTIPSLTGTLSSR